MDATTGFLRQHLINPEMCARCNGCEETCKKSAIRHDSMTYAVDAALCEGCADCLNVCSTGAIDNWRVVPRESPYTIEQQLKWTKLPDPLPFVPAPSTLETPDDRVSHIARPTAPASAPRPIAHRYGRESAVIARIRSNEAVTRTAADGAAVHHIVLEFEAESFPALEGQSIGIVPPGCDELGRGHHVRLYSVASARDGEIAGTSTIVVTVKRVLQDHAGHPVHGVCSNYLCDSPVGDEVRVTGPVGETFLMPDEPGTPLIMICTGTGIAPMRGMIQRRVRRDDARREDLLLFYGGRTPEELPYVAELASLGPERLDCTIGYSRVPGTPKRYVQDLVRARGPDLARLILERGATLYVCGLKNMEDGVSVALGEVLDATGADWTELSRQLALAGRYHVEVY
jgi:benzoyl-CoA 2,3-dioxygenase component A